MSDFSIENIFENLDYSDWLDAASNDLKLEDVEKVLNRKSLEGLNFKALSTSAKAIELDSFPKSRSAFKEINISNDIKSEINLELDNDINNFMISLSTLPLNLNFLDNDATFYFKLSENVEEIVSKLMSHPRSQQFIFLLDIAYMSEKSKVSFDDLIHDYEGLISMYPQMVWFVDGSRVHNAGGSMVQELAFVFSLGNRLVQSDSFKKNTCKIQFQLACDSLIFSNIAKLRAFRFIWERILGEYNISDLGIELYTTNSLREQTLYDPWVNILRNTSSSFAAILGGANLFNTYSYDVIYEKLTSEKREQLSNRIARNSLHILMLESHLHLVNDPMKGSYSVEDLTTQLIHNSWELFLHYSQRGGILENIDEFSKEVEMIFHERIQRIRTRKITLTGINNFANPDETINSLYNCAQVFEHTTGLFPIRRLAHQFEQLRMRYENCDKKLNGYIAMYGDPSKLSARSNFIKNYFEILGINMQESQGKNLSDNDHLTQMSDVSFIVICALDDDYEDIVKTAHKKFNDKKLFLAGKSEFDGIINLFMGQDVYSTLEKLVGELCQ